MMDLPIAIEVLSVGAIIFIVMIAVLLWGLAQHDTPTTVDRKGRVRCRPCDKLMYRSEESAKEAAALAGTRGVYLRAYRERRCGRWHLSSQEPRARRL